MLLKCAILLLLLGFIFSRYYSKLRLIVLLGFSLLLIQSSPTSPLDVTLSKREFIITGTVVSIPKTDQHKIQFLFKTDQLQADQMPRIIRLNWYRTDHVLVPGEVWRLRVKVKKPYGFMNPGGFNYERWLLRQGITLVGSVKADEQNQRIGLASGYFIERLRYQIQQEMSQRVAQPLLGFALALSIGDRSKLNLKQSQTMQKTGTSHLVAISGLHLSFVAGIIFFLARFIVSRFCLITKRLPASLFASIISFGFVFFYAALAGFSLPTQRALIMIFAVLLAFLFGRQLKALNIVLVAAALIVVLDPLAIMAADFWLSFMAVMFILYITRYRIGNENRLMALLRLQLFLSLALSPLLAFWFMQVPLYSVFANLIVIPLMGLVILPLLFLALLLLLLVPEWATILYAMIAKINTFYWYYLDFLATQSHSIAEVAMPNLVTLCLGVIGVLILLMPKGLPARPLGIVFLLPLLIPIVDKPQINEFDFTLLDVGQGLAAVIQTNNNVLIYDTGVRFASGFNTGDAVLKPYLKYNGIKTISMLLLSHDNLDHIGGADALIGSFNIEQMISSPPMQFGNHVTQSCHSGLKWQWDGVHFEILHPLRDTFFKGNNASCVLKVYSPHGAVLLTGDIEKEAEQRLLQRVPNQLKADVLVVPHHGSRTSSTLEFIKQVDPKYAFFASGYENQYGFPKHDIMQRYQSLGVQTRVSYQTGAISVQFRQGALKIEESRHSNQSISNNE